MPKKYTSKKKLDKLIEKFENREQRTEKPKRSLHDSKVNVNTIK